MTFICIPSTLSAWTPDEKSTLDPLYSNDWNIVSHNASSWERSGDIQTPGDDIFLNTSGGVAIGTTILPADVKLGVQGKIGATEYCDENGENCIQISNIVFWGGLSCSEGEIIKMKNGVWICSADTIGGRTDGGDMTNCADGSILKFSVISGEWECAPDLQGAIQNLSCKEGEIPKYKNGQWECALDTIGEGGVNDNFSCNFGEIIKFNGTSWECASDESGSGGESATWGSITGTLSSQSDLNTALNDRLSLSGGTMTGQLLLSGNPTSAFGAATKQYVDSAIAGGGDTNWILSGSDIYSGVSGNVGIGTASPTEKLVVDGNVRITNGSDICIEGGNCLSSVEGVSDNDWTVVGGGTQTDSCHAYQTYSSPYCTLTATNIGGGNYRLNYTIDFQNSGWWSRADATYGKIYPDDIRIDKTAAQQSGSVVVTPSQREIYWFRFPGGTVASPSPNPIICSIPAPIGGSASASGICGSAHESTFSSTPTANLCSSGTATAITTGAYTDASYYWQCVEQQTETMYSGVSGNVGIGTASPNAKLHVKTDTGTNAEIDIQSGELTHWGMYQDENTSDLQFWNTDNRVTFTNDGKVGIGTTSPTQALDVNGRIKGTELCIAGACRSSWPSGASWGSITGSLSSQSDLNTALNQRLSLSGGTMTGQLLLSGNPTSALGAATKQYVDGAVSAVSLKEIHDADNNTKVQVEESTNENKIRFDTNGTERMIIDNSGNVGIGTTSPLGKLHIYNPANAGAELILETVSSAQAAAIRFYADGIFLGNIGYLPGLDGMGIGGGNEQASSIFVQRNTQDVGIGTTSPLGKLHIYNPVNTGAELIVDSISTGITAIQLYSGGVSKGSISYNPAVGANTISLGSDTNGNVINILRTNNYVGIGTISPAYQLDVNGYIRGTNVAPSDIRLKKDIVTLSDSLSKILHLRGVSYFWKDSEKGEEKQIGVIAQEVEKEFPELVLEDNEGMKSVNYSALVAPLIEAVKEQQKEIERQQVQIELLSSKIEKLEQ
ncbi:tail fiber domain-containing protein [Candidatus Peregrinibacteria bacterium]|nr:MAG: tail fiber domain-containing protein [Candidatus Peregrinibacteria bacterium]